MDQTAIDRLLDRQSGVISRRQVLASEGGDALIARQVRRREWARVHDGVYVDHTGPLTWEQRAWAVVLYHWPAALDGDSALRAHGVRRAGLSRRDNDPIQVSIADDRWVARLPGTRVRRLVGFADLAGWSCRRRGWSWSRPSSPVPRRLPTMPGRLRCSVTSSSSGGPRSSGSRRRWSSDGN